MTKKTRNKSLKKSDESAVSIAFSSFPKNLLTTMKAKIMEKADISESTFYRILSGYRPKGPIRQVFSQILKQNEAELFPVVTVEK